MTSHFESVDELRASGRIAYEVVAGSHMYGTAVATSDIDIRGVFAFPKDVFTCVSSLKPQEEVSGDKQDTKFFELRKFIELAAECNPNVVELLWPPDDCVKIMTPLMQEIVSNRSLFVTKKAAMSFVGYARDQIAKARGQNKMVNNAEPEKEPSKDDHCFIIDDFRAVDGIPFGTHDFPARPKPLSRTGIDLSQYHCAALERVEGVYRLYHYGEGAKGVFRGNGMLVCESIPESDERRRFSGLLVYNERGFEKAHKDWKRYWTWMKERNQARWVGKDGGKFDYDHKNLMHCMRLLMSGINLIKNGEPIVRFSGADLKYLMDVRHGSHSYDELISKAELMIQDIDSSADKASIPSKPNVHKVNDLYRHLRDMADKEGNLKPTGGQHGTH
jgi:predicted nucleotidyltransferase